MPRIREVGLTADKTAITGAAIIHMGVMKRIGFTSTRIASLLKAGYLMGVALEEDCCNVVADHLEI